MPRGSCFRDSSHRALIGFAAGFEISATEHLPGSRKSSARVRDVMGLHFVLAVLDHLVRQSSLGNSMVRAPWNEWLAMGCCAAGPLPFRRAVPAIARACQ